MTLINLILTIKIIAESLNMTLNKNNTHISISLTDKQKKI